MRGYLHGFSVHRSDIVLILYIDIEMSFAVTRPLLRRATQIDGANNRSLCCVDHGHVRSCMAENVDAVLIAIEENAVRVALNINRLDHLHGVRVPHRNRFAGCEAMVRFRIYSHAVRAHIGNFAGRL